MRLLGDSHACKWKFPHMAGSSLCVVQESLELTALLSCTLIFLLMIEKHI